MPQFDFEKNSENLVNIFHALDNLESFSVRNIFAILRKYPDKITQNTISKDQLIAGLKYLFEHELIDTSEERLNFIIGKLKMKPVRSESGVTTVTVLTKPYACPGQCVFCPNDIRMPKSYIANEPGAQRALMNKFSPFDQVYNRLKAYTNIGHPIDKIELLVLGGTWSSYPEYYQVWFISECFRAMNIFSTENIEINLHVQKLDKFELEKDELNYKLKELYPETEYNHLLNKPEYKSWFTQNVVSDEDIRHIDLDSLWQNLFELQNVNSTSKSRCVGLVLETRSDRISEKEAIRMRKLGATKVQLGIQILNDEISTLNKRGENILDVANAFAILRKYGFKIHAHMMPNLYSATLDIDRDSYRSIFEDSRFCPDEMKIYPTSLIKHTELDKYWREGRYQPYTVSELVNLVADMIETTPEYCRITRVIRDIPSTEIEAGNTTTNLREIVEHKLQKEGRANRNIRAREIKSQKVSLSDLVLDELHYDTVTTVEIFLQYIIPETRQIAGFLRLSLPRMGNELMPNTAMIREVHVYGPSLELNAESDSQAQHLGLGTKLIERAKDIARANKYQKLAVISAIGTREYYTKRGFVDMVNFYQVADL